LPYHPSMMTAVPPAPLYRSEQAQVVPGLSRHRRRTATCGPNRARPARR
jgi:hypothetical protein